MTAGMSGDIFSAGTIFFVPAFVYSCRVEDKKSIALLAILFTQLNIATAAKKI